MTPQQLDQHMQSAVVLHQQGQLRQAEVLYREALKSFPQNSDIINLLGTLCSQDDRPEEGFALLQQALALQPDHPHYLLNLGQTQAQLGRLDDAIKSFDSVLDTMPGSAVTHFNLANCYKQKSQLDRACSHYETALAIDSSKEKYLYNYANTLQAAGRFKTAIEFYQKALAINPDNANAHNNIGIVLSKWERFDEAKQHYLKAIELRPDFIDALHNLSLYYESNGEISKARETLQRMRDIQPDNVHIALKQSLLIPLIAQHEDEINHSVSSLEAQLNSIDPAELNLEDCIKFDLSFPSISIYYGLDDAALRKRYAALFSAVIEPLPALSKKPKADRPKIAFIVTSGHEGVFVKCMAGLIRQLPKTVSCTVICSSPNGKLILEGDLPGAAYLEIDNDIETAARQIHAQCFDVLYYWEVGTDVYNYFLPYFKAARRQVGCWGWPTTSGIAAMDYFLSSELLEPAGAEKNYSEKLIKLPRLPVYYYRPPVPDKKFSKQHFGFEDGQHLYLCAQNLRKVQPQMDGVFLQILQQDDRAQILFIDDKRENVTQLLKLRLQDSVAAHYERIHFMQRMPAEEYLALVKTVDVLLDTFHYTGGANTNYDAFAAGTPVVTMPTAFHRGCYTAAAYRQINYSECIAMDEADYVRLAVTLANDKEFRNRASKAVINGCAALLEDQLAVDLFVENVYKICADIS